MSKNILTPEQLEQFNEWTADGNASKIDDNLWLEQTTQWSKQFTTDELKAFFKREYLSDSDNSSSSDNSIQFIPYNGSEIMFEPIYKEYFVSDEQFDSLEQAKNYIDAGSPLSEKTINAYRNGAFKDGGSVDMPPRSERKNKTLYHLIYIEGNDMGSMFFDNKKDAELKFDEEVKNGIEFIELSQDSFNEAGWLNNHNLYMVHDQFKNGGTVSKRYRVTNKKTGAIHFENANSPNHAILMVIKKVQMIYPNLTPNDFIASITEQYKDGGEIEVGDVVKVKDGDKYGYDSDYYVVADNVGYDRESFLISNVKKREQGVWDNDRLEKLYANGGGVDNSFDYQMLDRLRQDNDYFLGNGNRSEKHLWAGNVADQIMEMRKIYKRLSVKPKWLSMDDILEYERKMKSNSKDKFSDGGSIKEQNYDMIKSDNKQIMHHSKELDNILKTNKTIPAWALALVNQSSENLSNVTHYLDGAKKFATGGVSPQLYGQDVTFLDINGNEQIGMVQDMDDNGAELFYEERFIKIPTHKIVKFN